LFAFYPIHAKHNKQHSQVLRIKLNNELHLLDDDGGGNEGVGSDKMDDHDDEGRGVGGGGKE